MRRSTLTVVAAIASFVLVLGGCSGDDDDSSDTTSTTTEAAGETTTAPEAEDADVDCAAYTTVIDLFASAEEIATGSNDGQVAADESLAEALDALATAAEGDDIVTEALTTLGEVSFQVTDDASEGPSSDEIDVALATITDTWSETCNPADTSETTTVPGEAEGEGEGEATENPECPAPEVLEAEGFACDSEGNLTPLDEETVGECPAPEVLEAEGFTCDSEGNLTPVDPEESEGAEGPDGDQPTECPAPEVLEAEGYECDSEGNLTPVDE